MRILVAGALAVTTLLPAAARADEPGVETRLALAEAEVEEAALALRLGPSHPSLIAVRARAEALRAAIAEALPLDGEGLCQLHARLGELRARLAAREAELLTRYGERHAQVVEVRAQLAVADRHRDAVACSR